jgi:endoglucanase
MKQLILTILAVVAILLFPSLAGAETIVLKRGLPTDIWLTWPEGADLDQEKFINVFPEYRQEFKGGEFKLVKDAGFDFVRLTIDPAIFLSNRRPEKTKRLLAGVRAAIAEIRAAGLKVNVDMHSIPRDGNNPGTDQVLASTALFDQYLEVVTDIGKVVAEYPINDVSFEPLNEPTIDCTYDLNGANPRWPNMLKRLHETSRKAAPRTTLVLSGACWGGSDGLVALKPAAIKDDNIIWSFHSYDPFVFSHQGASWTEDVVGYVSGLSFPPVKGSKGKVMKAALAQIKAADVSANRKKVLIKDLQVYLDRYYEKGAPQVDAKAPFVQVAAWAKKNKIEPSRILLGEFGAIRGDKFAPHTDEARAPLVKLIRSEAEARGYGWSCWSWSGSFGMSRTPQSRDFSPVLMQALGL